MPCLQLSPGTRRILARKQALSANAGNSSPTSRDAAAQPGQSSPTQDFLGRLQQESETGSPNGARSSSGRPQAPLSGARHTGKAGNGLGSSGGCGSSSGGGSAGEGYTFKPRITPKAAAKKGRSVEEMSEGDRLRREVRLVSFLGGHWVRASAAGTADSMRGSGGQHAARLTCNCTHTVGLTTLGRTSIQALLRCSCRCMLFFTYRSSCV